MSNIRKMHNVMQLVKILWDYLYLGEQVEKSDCILGLGCYDLEIPKRCAELYHAGYAPIIIFSGGLGKNTDDSFFKSEAETFKDIAVSLGVPEDKILIENKSTNSGENFTFTKKLIEENNLEINTYLLVHKPYMERRAMSAFYAFNPDKKCYITSPQISFQDYFNMNHGIPNEEIINVLVGDIERMKVYAEKGWQIPQEIPDEVWKAFLELVSLGFDKYYIKGE